MVRQESFVFHMNYRNWLEQIVQLFYLIFSLFVNYVIQIICFCLKAVNFELHFAILLNWKKRKKVISFDKSALPIRHIYFWHHNIFNLTLFNLIFFPQISDFFLTASLRNCIIFKIFKKINKSLRVIWMELWKIKKHSEQYLSESNNSMLINMVTLTTSDLSQINSAGWKPICQKIK